jgi:hypothetical protein
MSALPSPTSVTNPPSRRAFRRYPLDARLDVITLRSGIPDSVPGRCTNLSEEGVGAVIAAELATEQHVGIELKLPHVSVPLQARAVVRHDNGLHFGLQFLKMSPEQREMIRYWAHRSVPAESAMLSPEAAAPLAEPETAMTEAPVDEGTRRKRVRIRRRRFFMLAAVILTLVLLAWWRWQKAWEELEKPIAQVASQPTVSQESTNPSPQVAAVEANRIPRHR